MTMGGRIEGGGKRGGGKGEERIEEVRGKERTKGGKGRVKG